MRVAGVCVTGLRGDQPASHCRSPRGHGGVPHVTLQVPALCAAPTWEDLRLGTVPPGPRRSHRPPEPERGKTREDAGGGRVGPWIPLPLGFDQVVLYHFIHSLRV